MTGRRAPPARPLPLRPETIRTRARREAERAPERRTSIFIEGLEIMASIGVHPHEHETRQRVRVDVTLDVADLPAPKDDRIAEVVNYETVVAAIEAMAREGHVQLVETLAERILAWCLSDARVAGARVRVAKPDAFDAADTVGCVIEARREARGSGET